jgi:hypothetical protein
MCKYNKKAPTKKEGANFIQSYITQGAIEAGLARVVLGAQLFRIS